MATLIQIRRGTSSQWSSANPVLASGELAVSTDLEKIKIGDGSSTWSNLLYINLTPAEIQSAIDSSVSSVLDGAPALLDTLNELAAALGDDENFASTITNSLADKLDISTASSTYLTQANAASSYDAIGSASAAQTSAEAYADGLATNYDPAGSASAVSSDLSDHELSTTSVHGITNTADLATKSYVDTAESDAVTSANSYSDGLAVNYDPAGSAATAESNSNSYTDTAVSNLVDSSPEALNTLNELAAALGDDANFATTIASQIGAKADTTTLDSHTSATTSVHGINNTANLIYTNDSRLSDTRTPTDNSVTSAKIVDGAIVNADINATAAIAPSKISGTAVVDSDARLTNSRTPTAHAATHESGGSDEIAINQSQVTNLTTDLSAKAPIASPTFTGNVTLSGDPISELQAATKAYVDTAESDAISSASSYADSLASNYDSAGTASSEVSTHNVDTTNVHGISDTSLLATTSYVDTAESDAVATANTYSNSLAINYDPAGSASAVGSDLTDHENSTTSVHGITNTADLATKAYADNAATTAAANLVDSAPGALDTLNELAAALGDDPNFATTVTNSLAGKQPLDADITAIANISPSATGFLVKDGDNVWSVDDSSYLTGNESITISGDASGSGSTSISITLANSGVSANTYGSSSQIPVISVDAKGRITSASVESVEGLPIQSANGGKYLTTNGTVASWDTIDLGTDTTGEYIATISGTTNEIEVTGSGSEGSEVTLSLPATINANTTGSAATLTTARSIGLSGDISGSASFDGSSNITITATVADDSHNHIISNVDGLQTVLDTKLNSSAYTAADVLTKIKTVDGSTSGLDADLLDGQDGSHYLDWTNTTNKPDPTITLGGDASGSLTLTDLAGGTLTVTVSDDSHNHIISNVDGLQTALNDKSPLASPSLTGTPTAPTAVLGTNTTQIATTAFVKAETAALIDSAPGTLDTLNELAAALGDDPNFATTISSSIAGKQPLDADLTAISSIIGTSGLLKKTAADTWSLDTNTYLTGNQSITLTGDVSGSGTTSISVTVADDSHNHIISNVDGLQSALDGKVDDSQVLTNVPLGAVFTDTVTNQTITLSGDATGSGTTAITVVVVDDSHSHSNSTISSLDAGKITTGTIAVARGGTGVTTSTGTGSVVLSASPTFTGTVNAAALDLTTAVTATAASHYWVATGSDGVVRPKTLANVQTEVVSNTAMQSNIVSPTSAGSTGIRKTTMSTSEPTGGADGDVWLVYA